MECIVAETGAVETLAGEGDGLRGAVYADPAASEGVRGQQRRAAAAAGVEDEIAWRAADTQNAFQEGERLLRGVAALLGRKAFDPGGVERGIVPHVVERHSLRVAAAAAPPIVRRMRTE